MSTKTFPEQEHEIIEQLQSLNNFQLSQKWKYEPNKCRYLLAIYFRSYQLSNIIKPNPEYKEKIELNYQQLWSFIFDKLLLSLPAEKYNLDLVLNLLTQDFFSKFATELELKKSSDLTDEQIRFLPLEYFVDKALTTLYPLERFIIVSKDKFSWSDEKICNYLQEHKQNLTNSEVNTYYMQGHSRLINALPNDIVTIYLN